MDEELDKAKKAFIKDIQFGFQKIPKQIPCHYLYDERGSDLYNQITQHPDYYLTRTEVDILNTNKKALSELLQGSAFNLLELGPGNGLKSRILISQFLQDQLQFKYIPMDVSLNYLEKVQTLFKIQFPTLIVKPKLQNYLNGLKKISTKTRNVILFLGSSIGNLDPIHIQFFLVGLWQSLNSADLIVLGFDLIKETHVLKRAYDDSSGVTRDFNLNLLTRMNRELGANFIVDQFQHHALFNEKNNAMESYLISKTQQTVDIQLMKEVYTLQKDEVIQTESSYKFQIKQIDDLARQNRFNIVARFSDAKNYFLTTVWAVDK